VWDKKKFIWLPLNPSRSCGGGARSLLCKFLKLIANLAPMREPRDVDGCYLVSLVSYLSIVPPRTFLVSFVKQRCLVTAIKHTHL